MRARTAASLPLLTLIASLALAGPSCSSKPPSTPDGQAAPAGSAGPSKSAGAALPDDDDDDDAHGPRGGPSQGQGADDDDRPAAPKRTGLEGGLDALEASDYKTAEDELTKAKSGATKGKALVGLARVALETGKLDEAVKLADEAARVDTASKVAAAPIKARALSRRGKLDEAQKACEAVSSEESAKRARLVLGEILIRRGDRKGARVPLMTLIEDFNAKRITTRDAEGMMLVGRAAQLLRVKRDANEAFDDAERAGNKSAELYLYRAQLFLDAYNYGRAEEMVRAALKQAPQLAAAHMLMAEVKLAQTLDFDTAEKAAAKALSIDKSLPEAHVVRAGIALRDMEIDQAEKSIAEGLAIDPIDLDLLSMKAATRFLADDKAGFEAAKKAVLGHNAEYARLYQIVAEYADWEHRYGEIVAMMKEATALDPKDGRSFVTLGLNQIRLGQEKEGVENLEKGFAKDKFNVRAYNTLNLFRDEIPQQYDTIDGTPFRVRYPKNERKVLERYVPGFLQSAWDDMRKRYTFTPTQPIGVELYGSRQQFSVRTTGLPNVGIQGVCFGETLAAISPKAEPFNWGMVVWHEVGHVFAIQLSKNHVPRWFTEGLSEYETLARRPEWAREEDPALWLALKRGRVPTLEQMNRAFTHAEDARDMTTAYYASSQIVVWLVEKHGMPKMVEMLKAWGQGKRTPEVIRSVLGQAPDEVDRQFRAWLDTRLARYKTQYMPDHRPKPLKEAAASAEANPKSAQAQIDLALARLARGDAKGGNDALEAARAIDAKNPDVHFIRARVAMQKKKADVATSELEAMIADGHDGYAVRVLLADLAMASKDEAKARGHFEAAAKLDPSQAEPLQALADMARKSKDEARELDALRRLAPLDQHDRRVWRRLLKLLVAKGEFAEARKVGEASLFVDIHGAETHALYAQALIGAGDADRAIFEAESALLCEPLKAKVASVAHTVLAKAHLKKGDRAKAREARDEALRQDPQNKEAEAISP